MKQKEILGLKGILDSLTNRVTALERTAIYVNYCPKCGRSTAMFPTESGSDFFGGAILLYGFVKYFVCLTCGTKYKSENKNVLTEVE